MEPLEASLTGTLRIIAILVVVWVLLRLLRQRFGGNGNPRGARTAPPDPRPKGDVRIERVQGADKKGGTTNGPVTDADYEEIK